MVAQETFHSPNFQYEWEGQKVTVDIDIHEDEIHEIHRFESGIKVIFFSKIKISITRPLLSRSDRFSPMSAPNSTSLVNKSFKNKFIL